MIENYSITEWMAFFFIYSFLGWCIEAQTDKQRLFKRSDAATVRFGSGNHAVINTLGKG